jgi:hypothetical protein
MVDYVTYYRVSTQKQGKSGLGLSAQKSKIEAFLSSNDRILQEFVDVRSGRKDDRTGLNKASCSGQGEKSHALDRSAGSLFSAGQLHRSDYGRRHIAMLCRNAKCF